MKRIILIVIIVLIVIGLGVGGFVLLQQNAPKQTGTIATQQPQSSQKKPIASSPLADIPGSYQVYSEQAFASAKGKRLLFFHAPWCPQCMMLDADIRKTALPDNLTIFKVDYDTATALRQKYGVTLQTTVVNVSQNGEMINKIVAYDVPSYALLKNAFNL